MIPLTQVKLHYREITQADWCDKISRALCPEEGVEGFRNWMSERDIRFYAPTERASNMFISHPDEDVLFEFRMRWL
jgi:hypothetical protein